MEIKYIIIEHFVIIIDSKSGKYFGFMIERPAICAQGNTINEVKEKINKIFEIDKKRKGP